MSVYSLLLTFYAYNANLKFPVIDVFVVLLAKVNCIQTADLSCEGLALFGRDGATDDCIFTV